MEVSDLLLDGFARVKEATHAVVHGLTVEQLSHRLSGRGNSIGWLVWHLTRVQDDHVCEVAGVEQTWTAHDWAARFALPFADTETGYQQGDAEVAALQVDAERLVGYYDAVHEQTTACVTKLNAGDLDRVVDENWDPPVTLGVRLISVLEDDLMHLGQAQFVRGLLD